VPQANLGLWDAIPLGLGEEGGRVQDGEAGDEGCGWVVGGE
jgi:hypothetical protein